jgi:hypothetical protein
MEFLDRYLHAVGKYLPTKRREDILAELRVNLLEQAEDKEAEIGHPLTLEEEEALLKQYGRPFVAAARYLPQQYLIGPAVFPFYLYALRTAMPLVFLAYVVVNAAVFLHEPVTASRVLGMLVRLPMVALYAAAWITGIAAVIEFTHTKLSHISPLGGDWNPRDLPPVETTADYRLGSSILEVVGSGVFVLFLLSVPQVPYLVLGPGSTLLKYAQPAPVWHTAYWAFLTLMIAQWAIEMVGLFWASWRRTRPLLGLLGQCVMVGICSLLLRAPLLFTITEEGRNSSQYQALIGNLNRGLLIALKLGVIFFVLHILWDGGRMIWGQLQSPSPTTSVHGVHKGVL